MKRKVSRSSEGRRNKKFDVSLNLYNGVFQGIGKLKFLFIDHKLFVNNKKHSDTCFPNKTNNKEYISMGIFLINFLLHDQYYH